VIGDSELEYEARINYTMNAFENVTMTVSGQYCYYNATLNLIPPNGTEYYFRVYANDTSANENVTEDRAWTYDSTDTEPPDPEFVSPTAANQTNGSTTWFYVNVSGGETLSACTLNLYPEVVVNELGPAEGPPFNIRYHVNYTAGHASFITTDTEHAEIGRYATDQGGGNWNFSHYRGILPWDISSITSNVTNATMSIYVNHSNSATDQEVAPDTYWYVFLNSTTDYAESYCDNNVSIEYECWNLTTLNATLLDEVDIFAINGSYVQDPFYIDISTEINDEIAQDDIFWVYVKSNKENYSEYDDEEGLILYNVIDGCEQCYPRINYTMEAYENITMTVSGQYCYYNASLTLLPTNMTEYYFQVYAEDSEGNQNVTEARAWTYSAPDITAPVITSDQVNETAPYRLGEVRFQADVSDDSSVTVLFTVTYPNASTANITGSLLSGTTYYYDLDIDQYETGTPYTFVGVYATDSGSYQSYTANGTGIYPIGVQATDVHMIPKDKPAQLMRLDNTLGRQQVRWDRGLTTGDAPEVPHEFGNDYCDNDDVNLTITTEKEVLWDFVGFGIRGTYNVRGDIYPAALGHFCDPRPSNSSCYDSGGSYYGATQSELYDALVDYCFYGYCNIHGYYHDVLAEASDDYGWPWVASPQDNRSSLPSTTFRTSYEIGEGSMNSTTYSFPGWVSDATKKTNIFNQGIKFITQTRDSASNYTDLDDMTKGSPDDFDLNPMCFWAGQDRHEDSPCYANGGFTPETFWIDVKAVMATDCTNCFMHQLHLPSTIRGYWCANDYGGWWNNRNTTTNVNDAHYNNFTQSMSDIVSGNNNADNIVFMTSPEIWSAMVALKDSAVTATKYTTDYVVNLSEAAEVNASFAFLWNGQVNDSITDAYDYQWVISGDTEYTIAWVNFLDNGNDANINMTHNTIMKVNNTDGLSVLRKWNDTQFTFWSNVTQNVTFYFDTTSYQRIHQFRGSRRPAI
jgi:hypothetical protein